MPRWLPNGSAVWGKVAQQLSHLKKGQRVSVIGRLESREWADAKGIQHHSIEIVVERFSVELNNEKTKVQKDADATEAEAQEEDLPL